MGAVVDIRQENLDPEFKFILGRIPGAEEFRRCFACGTCTGICPVNKNDMDYDPRRIIHMAVLGLKVRLLSSPMIWQCTRCDTCQFSCPQGVRMSTVIAALRQMAVEGSYVDSKTLQTWGKMAMVKAGRCVGCLTCVRVCPFDAVKSGKEKRAFVQVDPLKCRACGLCAAECPRGAITVNVEGVALAI